MSFPVFVLRSLYTLSFVERQRFSNFPKFFQFHFLRGLVSNFPTTHRNFLWVSFCGRWKMQRSLYVEQMRATRSTYQITNLNAVLRHPVFATSHGNVFPNGLYGSSVMEYRCFGFDVYVTLPYMPI